MAPERAIAYVFAMTQPHRPVGPGDHVFLVDGSSFVFRAYFQSIRQDQKYNYRSDRLPMGAVRLFATKLLQFVRDGAAGTVSGLNFWLRSAACGVEFSRNSPICGISRDSD